MKIEKLFEGDPRCATLVDALKETLYERGKGIPIPSILGVLDLLKDEVKNDAKGL